MFTSNTSLKTLRSPYWLCCLRSGVTSTQTALPVNSGQGSKSLLLALIFIGSLFCFVCCFVLAGTRVSPAWASLASPNWLRGVRAWARAQAPVLEHEQRISRFESYLQV